MSECMVFVLQNPSLAFIGMFGLLAGTAR